MSPGEYAKSYANLFTWFWNGDDWVSRRAPIINYLQNNHNPQSARALAAEAALRRVMDREIGSDARKKTFRYVEYDYINNSIKRCFIGKACPWEIQETLQLASEIGALSEPKLLDYCLNILGVDCGGFVANYWGEACPHMAHPAPPGFDGILPRGFWANTQLFPDVMKRRRKTLESVRPGDAAIHFKDVVKNNPDIVKQGTPGHYIAGTGSEAFHIGLVETISSSTIAIAESSEGKKSLGGNGVGVREAAVEEVGKSGEWVYCKTGANTWLYFVAPPWGWGPDTAYNIGEA